MTRLLIVVLFICFLPVAVLGVACDVLAGAFLVGFNHFGARRFPDAVSR